MIYLLNGNEYNTIFYILIILLILIVVAIFYLVYTQHKEMIKVFGKQDETNKENVIKSNKEDIVIENTMSNVELPIMKEENSISLNEEKKDVIEQVTEDDIPDKFDYTQALWQKDEFDLSALSHELENKGAIRRTVADKYEVEQEEKAIISYDELVDKVNKEKEIPFELPKMNSNSDENSNNKYEHEEMYLNKLKELNSILK